jgi:hypothetical protein
MTEPRPRILILDALTGEVTDRELDDDEFAAYQQQAQIIRDAGLDRHWIGDQKE